MNRILYILGFAMLLIPVGWRLIEGEKQEETIATYVKEIEHADEGDLAKQWKLAQQYNQTLYEDKVADMEAYGEILNFFGDGMMGSIEIPKIAVKLPIYHGAGEEVLAAGIGHLKESSLPVGGGNTHSVLTGHRGVPNAQLFTRLDELERGDLFFLHVCQETLCYRVCEIQVVEPEETETIAIREGEDLVSLVTCTPYGLNTHRLIVTGKRDAECADVMDVVETGKLSKWDKAYLALPCLFGAATMIRGRKRKGVSP